MIKFYVRENAPLKFHKFYHLVLTPLNIILTLFALIPMLMGKQATNTLIIVYDILILASCVLTFIGCFKFKKYAWWAIILGFALEIFYDVFLVAFALYATPALIIDVLSQTVWRFAFIIVMSIYYIKRRPLFFDPIPYEEIQEELRKTRAMKDIKIKEDTQKQ